MRCAAPPAKNAAALCADPVQWVESSAQEQVVCIGAAWNQQQRDASHDWLLDLDAGAGELIVGPKRMFFMVRSPSHQPMHCHCPAMKDGILLAMHICRIVC